MRSGLFLATMQAASSLAAAEAPLTIDQLLAQGWEIAGYASGYDTGRVLEVTDKSRRAFGKLRRARDRFSIFR